MPILVGIDGTGAMSNAEYRDDFKKSFVRQLCPVDYSPGVQSDNVYFRGPIGPGGGLTDAIYAGLEFVKKAYPLKVVDKRVLLTGYSRGGLGVLVIARKLKKVGIPVAAMLLFDAVDRHLFWDCPVVPNNVAEVLHLRRSPLSGSRGSFGNCGTSAVSPTIYNEQYFVCTHGGMGGTFWKQGDHRADEKIHEGFPDNKTTNITYEQDERVSADVGRTAMPFIQKHGFPNSIR